MNRIRVEAFGWMRCQSGIVVGFLDQVLGASAAIVKPRYPVNRLIFDVGDENSILHAAHGEQLVLLYRIFLIGFLRIVVAQRHVSEFALPSLRLVAELALRIGI